jgi:hypothetical protein
MNFSLKVEICYFLQTLIKILFKNLFFFNFYQNLVTQRQKPQKRREMKKGEQEEESVI